MEMIREGAIMKMYNQNLPSGFDLAFLDEPKLECRYCQGNYDHELIDEGVCHHCRNYDALISEEEYHELCELENR